MSKRSPASACPCCGHVVITDEFDICPICRWEYNDFQHNNIDDEGGPNHVSLRKAQMRFLKNEPIEEGMEGRETDANEYRDPNWKPIE